ncbi:protein bunched, class 2/F/G isoform isoform X2 [Halyomorpha halys]|uniref:protein bunched, class 2/F/G isoform isoform X2 n=1 Tax=Halyomorpha halys TaxID=286706 RepID=UPI0006D4F052|nr:putative mediator of RNA polymerase II transcription subunit 26 isoform X2 [Halyomorpha halys]
MADSASVLTSKISEKGKLNNSINRTTSETLRLNDSEKVVNSPNSLSSTAPRKKTSFQITSVIVGSRTSNDGGDDSADDLDESHAEDISEVLDNSRITDLENETPSYSEDTFSKDDVFFNASSSLVSAPVIPTSSQYGLAIVATPENSESALNPPDSSGNSDTADTTGGDVTESVINLGVVSTKHDPEMRDMHPPAPRTERFKVVKIESTEPFKRGRWVCMDYLDHNIAQKEQSQVSSAKIESSECNIQVGIASEIPNSAPSDYTSSVNSVIEVSPLESQVPVPTEHINNCTPLNMQPNESSQVSSCQMPISSVPSAVPTSYPSVSPGQSLQNSMQMGHIINSSAPPPQVSQQQSQSLSQVNMQQILGNTSQHQSLQSQQMQQILSGANVMPMQQQQAPLPQTMQQQQPVMQQPMQTMQQIHQPNQQYQPQQQQAMPPQQNIQQQQTMPQQQAPMPQQQTMPQSIPQPQQTIPQQQSLPQQQTLPQQAAVSQSQPTLTQQQALQQQTMQQTLPPQQQQAMPQQQPLPQQQPIPPQSQTLPQQQTIPQQPQGIPQQQTLSQPQQQQTMPQQQQTMPQQQQQQMPQQQSMPQQQQSLPQQQQSMPQQQQSMPQQQQSMPQQQQPIPQQQQPQQIPQQQTMPQQQQTMAQQQQPMTQQQQAMPQQQPIPQQQFQTLQQQQQPMMQQQMPQQTLQTQMPVQQVQMQPNVLQMPIQPQNQQQQMMQQSLQQMQQQPSQMHQVPYSQAMQQTQQPVMTQAGQQQVPGMLPQMHPQMGYQTNQMMAGMQPQPIMNIQSQPHLQPQYYQTPQQMPTGIITSQPGMMTQGGMTQVSMQGSTPNLPPLQTYPTASVPQPMQVQGMPQTPPIPTSVQYTMPHLSQTSQPLSIPTSMQQQMSMPQPQPTPQQQPPLQQPPPQPAQSYAGVSSPAQSYTHGMSSSSVPSALMMEHPLLNGEHPENPTAALIESLNEVTAPGEEQGEDAESTSGANAVAIDNKIEQAMDLVKSHLMYAVREEVEVLKEKIAELMERIGQLEAENATLRAGATPETLALLPPPSQTTTTNP